MAIFINIKNAQGCCLRKLNTVVPGNSTSGLVPRRSEAKTGLDCQTPVLTVALFTTDKRRNKRRLNSTPLKGPDAVTVVYSSIMLPGKKEATHATHRRTLKTLG